MRLYDSKLLTEGRYKKIECDFCKTTVDSQHFTRHLRRHHKDVREIRVLMKMDSEIKELQKSKKEEGRLKELKEEKKRVIKVLRNMGNMESAVSGGGMIPARRNKEVTATERTHVLCPHCKGYIKRTYLA